MALRTMCGILSSSLILLRFKIVCNLFGTGCTSRVEFCRNISPCWEILKIIIRFGDDYLKLTIASGSHNVNAATTDWFLCK